MPKLPVLKSKDVYRILIRYGCEPVSIKSSHFKVRNPRTGAISIVPIHSGEDLKKSLLASILKQLDIDPDDFIGFISK